MITKNMFYEILDEMQPEDLPDTFAIITEAIGKEAVWKLAQALNGTTVYVPTAYSIIKKGITKRILNEFDGYNSSRLALKYGVSDTTVKNIIKLQREQRRKP